MLLSPRAAPAFPEDNIQDIFSQIEHQIKDRPFDENGMIFTVNHSAKKWKLLLVPKYADTSTKKLKPKDLDFYVFDPDDMSSILGQGSQGKVVLTRELTTGKLGAVKIQTANTPSFDQDLKIERRNLNLAGRLYAIASEVPDEQKLTGLTPDQIESFIAKETIHYTLMVFTPGKDLIDFLYETDKQHPDNSPLHFVKKKELDLLSVARLAIYAIKEVISLHDIVGLAHRDIKTGNFRVNTPGALNEVTALKLIDLGTAILHKEKCKEDASSIGYLPPEFLKPIKERPAWDKACDVWQLGIVIAEMLTKYNYQAGIKKHALSQQESQEKRHMTVDEIQHLMPDIFLTSTKSAKLEKKAKEKSAKDSQENIMQDLHTQLMETIQLFTHVDRDKRPTDEALRQAFKNLNNTYFRAHTISSFTNPSDKLAKYKALKRQNTVLDIPKVSSSSSPKLVSFSQEAPVLGARPVRSQSSAVEKPHRIDVIRSPRKRTSTESKVREVTNIEHDIAKMEQDLATLSLVPTQESLSPRIPHTTEEVLERLRNLQKTMSLQTGVENSDFLKIGVSDFMMFSLIGKRLKSALEERGEAQQRQLSSLQQLTEKFIPSRNIQLNQYVESIKTTLSSANPKK